MYGCVFVARWSLLYAFSIILLLTVWFVLFLSTTYWPVVLTTYVLVVCVLVLLHLRSTRIYTRVGRLCRFGPAPRTEEELRKAWVQSKGSASIVGSGWGFWLQRVGVSSPCIFTHRLQGLVYPENDLLYDYWYAGTPLYDVLLTLARMGRTLSSAPAIDDITLGAWIAGGSHGSAGPAAMTIEGNDKTHSKFQTVALMHRDGIVKEYEAVKAKRMLRDTPQEYVVVWVQLRTVRDIDVRKDARIMRDQSDVNWWLAEDAIQRLLFVGGHDAFGLKWIDKQIESQELKAIDHRDPHLCQRNCQWFQADIVGAMCRGCLVPCLRHKPIEAWKGWSKLSDALRFAPQLTPISASISIMVDNRNFELFFDADIEDMRDRLQPLLETLHAFHSVYSGRTELRHGGARSNGGTYALMLDVGVSGAHIHDYLQYIYQNHFGKVDVAIHMSKMDVTSQLRRVGFNAVSRMEMSDRTRRKRKKTLSFRV